MRSNEALQYREWLRAQGRGKARLSKEGPRKNPIKQQDYDMAEQERMQERAKDGGQTSYGGAGSGENLGNQKREVLFQRC